MTYDGANYYSYDAEGRLCAMQTYPSSGGAMAYGYLYDADGTRVAKGTITASPNPATQPLSCDPNSNGFQPTANYVLGSSGEQVTEMDMNGSSMTWNHTNVWAGGKLLATYSATTSNTVFALSDWLDTKRVEVGASPCASAYASLPFGENQTPPSVAGYSSCADDATEHHFTGKERDTESGNDYFGARYYASSMGRFMTPDPSTLEYADPTNPQSFNLYSYVLNNPLINFDPDGLQCFQVDSDGNFTGTSNAGDCATDANGNPTNNDVYIDDEKATNPFMDSNGDLLGYTNGGGQQVGADGNPWCMSFTSGRAIARSSTLRQRWTSTAFSRKGQRTSMMRLKPS